MAGKSKPPEPGHGPKYSVVVAAVGSSRLWWLIDNLCLSDVASHATWSGLSCRHATYVVACARARRGASAPHRTARAGGPSRKVELAGRIC